MNKSIHRSQGLFRLGNISEVDSEFFQNRFKDSRNCMVSSTPLNILRDKLVVVSNHEIKLKEKHHPTFVRAAIRWWRWIVCRQTTELKWKLTHKILMSTFEPQAIRDVSIDDGCLFTIISPLEMFYWIGY